jgi:pyrimidine deaminase RibD-like protein
MGEATKFENHMRTAIDEGKASKAEDVRPHPRVGAVLIRDGLVLASAHRGELGDGDHAEFTIFEKKLRGMDLEGSTLFTTLEPCTSRGTRKPCADWILEKKVSTVFVGMLDPNPRVYTRGVSKLRSHGIEVSYFPEPLRKEIESDNASFVAQFHASPALTGRARFNYGDNDGIFTIGHGDWLFETKWSKASDVAIHVYNDPPSIAGLAIAIDALALEDIRDASIYNMSSRNRTPKEGEFVVLKNANGNFAALKVLEVRDRSRADTEDELLFEYWILEGGLSDFSRAAPGAGT